MNLVFDFGGVLFRWRPAQLLQQVLPQHAKDAASAAFWAQQFFAVPGGGWADFDRGTVSSGELVARIAQRTGLSAQDVQAVVDAVPAELAPIAESLALLQRLRCHAHASGRRLFYLSNMPAPYADYLERTHGFVREFDAGVFSARVKLIKPQPEIYALAAQRFGVPPAELLFLDDHLPNVLAAQAAGWAALHFSSAAQCAADLARLGWWQEAA
jgi:putative hydrolase of the HAD superfamily